jgi:hypothetical protein
LIFNRIKIENNVLDCLLQISANAGSLTVNH